MAPHVRRSILPSFHYWGPPTHAYCSAQVDPQNDPVSGVRGGRLDRLVRSPSRCAHVADARHPLQTIGESSGTLELAACNQPPSVQQLPSRPAEEPNPALLKVGVAIDVPARVRAGEWPGLRRKGKGEGSAGLHHGCKRGSSPHGGRGGAKRRAGRRRHPRDRRRPRSPLLRLPPPSTESGRLSQREEPALPPKPATARRDAGQRRTKGRP